MRERYKIILIMLCVLFLYGCSNKEEENILKHSVTADSADNPAEDLQDRVREETDTQPNKAPDVIEPVTGDDLTVAGEFAGDLSDENFARLVQAYSYDDRMKAAMESGETKKTILFNNAKYGELKKRNEAYTYVIGAYQYVIVPVECSGENFNYQIAFNRNHNIVGFSYGQYALKESTDYDAMPEQITETEYSFTSDGFVLTGTFTAPVEGDHYPVVVFVQGSGPLNRDEAIYENKPFRDIAWALAREGIASYRYDKRRYLYEEQMRSDVTVTIKDEVTEDVAAAADMVKDLEKVDPDSIYILGHSLGGYMIPELAQELPRTAGFIMMGAPAEHLKEYLYKQYKYLAGEDETITAKEQKQLRERNKQIKLLNHPKSIPDNQMVLGEYKDYWINLLAYDPVKTAENLEKPVLVLQGERDYQVTMKQFNLWKENFGASENWVFQSYPLLNHFMMKGSGQSYPGEYKIRSQVDNSVIQDIIQFIKKGR